MASVGAAGAAVPLVREGEGEKVVGRGSAPGTSEEHSEVTSESWTQSKGEREAGEEGRSTGESEGAGSEEKGKGKHEKDGVKRKKREYPPLVIPDEPVKRYPEPSRDELKKLLDEQKEIIKEANARIDTIKDFYEQRSKIREAGRDEFNAARKLQNDLSTELHAKFENKKSLSAKISKIREQDMAASGSRGHEAKADVHPALKNLRTVEEVDARIQELEYQHSTASFSIAAEKKIIAEIAYLKHKGRMFILDREKAIKDERTAKEQRLTQRKELEEARRAVDVEIDALKAKLEAQRATVDEIRRKQDAEIETLSAKFSTVDREAEWKKINEAKAAQKKARDAFGAELDKWYLNERIFREQQRIAKRKKWEAVQAEREARRLAHEAEMAKYPAPHPYQKEKDMCSNLIAYLNKLGGVAQAKRSSILAPEKGNVPSLSKALPVREISTKGRAIGKGAETEDQSTEFFGGFTKKTSRKGRKRGKRLDEADRGGSSSTTTATSPDKSNVSLPPHSMERFSAFTQLDIKPPLKYGEIASTIDAIKAKLAYFDSAPPPEEVKEKKEVKPKADSKERKKKIEDAGKLTLGAYPTMNGLEGRKPAGSTLPNGGNEKLAEEPAESSTGQASGPTTDASVKRPSFADIMAGKAKTPAVVMPVVEAHIPDVQASGAEETAKE